MTAALEEVQKGRYSICTISRMYGVPKTTLNDRVIGKAQHGINPGPHPYLNKDEEKKLADHLFTVAKIGYGRSSSKSNLLQRMLPEERGY